MNLTKDTHEDLKIYATVNGLNLDEAVEELLSIEMVRLKENNGGNIEDIITFEGLKRKKDKEQYKNNEINKNKKEDNLNKEVN